MQILRSFRPAPALVLSTAVFACGGGDAPDDDAPDAATAETREPEPEEDEAEAGVPEGGLERWVSDIRRGLEDVELNPRTSYDRVVELYTTRQEYIELFYGPGGTLTGDDHPGLAEAVEEQEARFHDLMELTGSDQQIQRERILGGVRDLRLALGRTLDLARDGDVPLVPPEAEDSGA